MQRMRGTLREAAFWPALKYSMACWHPGQQVGFVPLPRVLQYMVVYQLLVSLAVNTAFFMDGSWLSVTQVSS